MRPWPIVGRGVIARFLPAANLAIDACTDEPRRKAGAGQKMIDARSAIALEVISKVIPEAIDGLLGMHLAQRVRPAAREKSGEGGTRPGPEQRDIVEVAEETRGMAII
jgi:hypothetical protein